MVLPVKEDIPNCAIDPVFVVIEDAVKEDS